MRFRQRHEGACKEAKNEVEIKKTNNNEAVAVAVGGRGGSNFELDRREKYRGAGFRSYTRVRPEGGVVVHAGYLSACVQQYGISVSIFE